MKIKMKIYTVACYSHQVFLDIKTYYHHMEKE